MQPAPGMPSMHPGAVKGMSNPWRGQQYFAAQDYRSVPASFSWDCGADQVLQVTLSANSTISFPTNAQRGATYILVVKQDATGSRTLSYTNQSGQQTNGSWKWPGGTTPTLTTTAGKRDILTFYFDGTDMLGTSVLNL